MEAHAQTPKGMEQLAAYAVIVGWVVKHEGAIMEALGTMAAGAGSKFGPAARSMPSVEIAQVSRMLEEHKLSGTKP